MIIRPHSLCPTQLLACSARRISKDSCKGASDQYSLLGQATRPILGCTCMSLLRTRAKFGTPNGSTVTSFVVSSRRRSVRCTWDRS
jgi:hypothetical protein